MKRIVGHDDGNLGIVLPNRFQESLQKIEAEEHGHADCRISDVGGSESGRLRNGDRRASGLRQARSGCFWSIEPARRLKPDCRRLVAVAVAERGNPVAGMVAQARHVVVAVPLEGRKRKDREDIGVGVGDVGLRFGAAEQSLKRLPRKAVGQRAPAALAEIDRLPAVDGRVVAEIPAGSVERREAPTIVRQRVNGMLQPQRGVLGQLDIVFADHQELGRGVLREPLGCLPPIPPSPEPSRILVYRHTACGRDGRARLREEIDRLRETAAAQRREAAIHGCRAPRRGNHGDRQQRGPQVDLVNQRPRGIHRAVAISLREAGMEQQREIGVGGGMVDAMASAAIRRADRSRECDDLWRRAQPFVGAKLAAPMTAWRQEVRHGSSGLHDEAQCDAARRSHKVEAVRAETIPVRAAEYHAGGNRSRADRLLQQLGRGAEAG